MGIENEKHFSTSKYQLFQNTFNMYLLRTKNNEREFLTLSAAMQKMDRLRVPCEITPFDTGGEDPPVYKKVRVHDVSETYMGYFKYDGDNERAIEESQFLEDLYELSETELTEPTIN